MTSRLRLAVMATHREAELRAAARTLGRRRPGGRLRSARREVVRCADASGEPRPRSRSRRRDAGSRAAARRRRVAAQTGVFDFEARGQTRRAA